MIAPATTATAPAVTRTALVLAAHGSHDGSPANALVERHAAALAARGVADEVVTAFHLGEPSFSTVLDSLAAERVVVVPFFTSGGYFTAEVVPAALRQNRRYAEIAVAQSPPVGTHPLLSQIVARRVDALRAVWGRGVRHCTVMVVGHGTPRHAASRDATEALVRALAARRAEDQVLSAFLDDEPSIEAALQRSHSSLVVVVPFLIGGGGHALQDIPARLGVSVAPGTAWPIATQVGDRTIVLDVPLGVQPELVDLLADLARRHLPAGGATRRPAADSATVGIVSLVGAGPGDPGLITWRGLEAIRQADVILHDRLIPEALLLEAAGGAEIIDVGKGPGTARAGQDDIHRLLLQHARLGRRVVRLKGGDPFVFGRATEELLLCEAAGIPCEVVPGISSAIAVPAAAGIPVTTRGAARSFAVITAQTEPGGRETFDPAQARALVAIDTLVVLMGRARLAEIATALMEAGRSGDTPAACIERGTMPGQRTVRATLATIASAADEAQLRSPMVTVLGEVAALSLPVALPC